MEGLGGCSLDDHEVVISKKRRAAIVEYDSPAASLAGIKTAKERQSKKMDFVAEIVIVS